MRAGLETIAWGSVDASYLTDIIDSVLDGRADKVLAVTTSMHDLVVAPAPANDPPLDVVIVAAPGSPRGHPDGTVRIEHLAVNGRNTEIVRPVSEAVPLFWRSMREAFGLAVQR